MTLQQLLQVVAATVIAVWVICAAGSELLHAAKGSELCYGAARGCVFSFHKLLGG
jgi:hypothetical protein